MLTRVALPFAISSSKSAPHTLGNTDPTPAAASFTIDTTPPQTSITEKPPAKTRDRTPRFRFTSGEPGTFICSIESKPFWPWGSPKTYGELSLGAHLFQVKVTDGAVNEDATAAREKFKIVGRKASRPARSG